VTAWHEGESVESELAQQWFAAERHLDAVIAADPERQSLYARRGAARLLREMNEEAAADFTRAIDLGESGPAAWLGRGKAQARLSRWDQALDDCTRAISLGAEGPDAWHYRGWAHQSLRHWEEAIADYTEAIQRKDADPWVWERRATAHAERGDWVPAEADLVEAVEKRSSGDESAWASYALLRLRAGDAEGYRKRLDALLKQFGDTKDSDAANTVAWACALDPQGGPDVRRAVRLAELAVKAAPKDMNSLGTLAAAYYRAGRFDAARERLEEVLRRGGNESPAYDWLFLAMTEWRRGHAEAARKWLDQAAAWIDGQAKKPAAAAGTPGYLDWGRRVELQLLRREAETLLKGTPPGPKK
jgi:tetratricopeptide (TPR) repeat protein